MINNDRIVPVTAIDLISLYGLIIGQGATLSAVNAETVDGKFVISSAPNALIASEPVSLCDFTVDAATLYFVPAYDYAGFEINGVATATTGAEVKADGKSLYSATLATGVITIAKIGF